MKKIVITTTTFGQYDKKPLALLKEKGFQIILNPKGRKLTAKEVVMLCRDTVGIIAGTEPLHADILEALHQLKVISRCGTGLDNVDLKAAKRLKIKVFNTPDAPTLAVAELTVGLMLNLLRRVNTMDTAIRKGQWKKITGNLLSQKKVGIIGFGRIGQNVAKFLKSFSCDVAYCDPYLQGGILGLKRLPLKQLLPWADIVTVHVSSRHKILSKAELGIMKKGAWLINTSRGEILDEGALLQCLKRGRLSGAAIDVFQKEPYRGPFRTLKNVILTPHIGSYAREARVHMELVAARNLLVGLGR